MPDKTKSTDYKRKFNSENYDRIELTVKKGKKDMLKKHAADCGETLNGFINRAITETLERDEAALSFGKRSGKKGAERINCK